MINGCWHIFTWPSVALTVRSLKAHVGDVRHIESYGAPTDDAHEPARGLTAWGFVSAEGPVGIAWEWVSLRGGAVALGDPMTVVSNLALLDDRQALLPPARRLLMLHELIYGMPWQQALPRGPVPNAAGAVNAPARAGTSW